MNNPYGFTAEEIQSLMRLVSKTGETELIPGVWLISRKHARELYPAIDTSTHPYYIDRDALTKTLTGVTTPTEILEAL